MNTIDSKQYSEFIKGLSDHNHWTSQSPIETMSFLFEETGELSRAVRSIEIGRKHPGEKPLTKQQKQANLTEELGDVLSQLTTVAEKYDLSLDDLINNNYQKLSKRWHYYLKQPTNNLHQYTKTTTVIAEQFTSSPEQIKKYYITKCIDVTHNVPKNRYRLKTLNGYDFIKPGDWLVTNQPGDTYVVSDSIFKKTYKLVN